MTNPWLSYVPQHVARAILQHPGQNPAGQAERFDAVGAFMDISGFSAMSEALGRAGKVGSEELTDVLNRTFDPLITLIESYGGVIGKFGGDALTVLYPYTPATQAETVRRALQCALDVQAQMKANETITTRVGDFKLAIKIGLAMGGVLCLTVGDPASRLEYVIAGEILDRCAEAEHHAEKGDVVLDKVLLPFGPDAQIIEDREDFRLLGRLTQPVSLNPLLHAEDVPDQAVDTLAAFLHPTIAQRIRNQQTGFINEHRQVTVLFVSFSGFDYDRDPAINSKLQDYLNAVIGIVSRYDGYLNKVDMGDKGSKFIILFGAPIAHGDDEERALRCAMAISELPVTARIGVNTGFVYCGQVGSALRQEYTVMGDAVNVAARLMQATKPGQILVSQSTRRPCAPRFVWDLLPPLTVKGKVDPVPVALLTGTAQNVELQEPGYSLPMVGRSREMAQVQTLIGQAMGGRGQIIGITGSAGMGKSRLNAEVIKLALGQGMAGFGGECQSYGTITSYLLWNKIWRGLFEINGNWTPERQLQHLQTRLGEIDPDFPVRAPLLDQVLGLNIPDNDVTEALEGQARQDSLDALLLDCLQWRAKKSPLLLVLEDCHWIDPLSVQLLDYIGRNISDLPVLVTLVYRPEATDLDTVKVLDHFTEIALKEFMADDVRELVQKKIEGLYGQDEHLPPALIERIVERAEGSPFYVEEFVNLIHDREIRLRDETALNALELPAGLHSLIISRIDQLAEDQKTTLKIASIIGRLFRAGWVWGAYPNFGTPESVLNDLRNLSQTELTSVMKPEPELEYLFKHIVTQEVAYDSLAYATRQNLHDQFAGYVETHIADLPGYLDVLAFHYGRGGNEAKKREYFRKAGEAAKEAFANEAAVEYYERLLPLLAESERGRALLALGEIWQLTGKWAEAEQAYRESLSLAEAANNDLLIAECQSNLGDLLAFSAAPSEAIEWLEKARTGFAAIKADAGLARTLQRLGVTYLRQSNHAKALECMDEQLPIARRIGDERGAIENYMGRGWIYRDQGNFEQSIVSLEAALKLATEINDLPLQISANGDLLGVYYFMGDIKQAADYCLRALAIADQIGHLRAIGQIIGNYGELFRQQGSYSKALGCYIQGLSTALELGDLEGVIVAVINIGAVYAAENKFESGVELYKRAISLGRKLNVAPYAICECLYYQSEASLKLSRPAEAEALANEALTLANEIGIADLQFKAEVLVARLKILRDPSTRPELENLLEKWNDPMQQAAIHYELWRLDNTRSTDQQAAAATYHELYEQMPLMEFRDRYIELTGESLPAATLDLELPELVQQGATDLDALLVRVAALD